MTAVPYRGQEKVRRGTNAGNLQERAHLERVRKEALQQIEEEEHKIRKYKLKLRDHELQLAQRIKDNEAANSMEHKPTDNHGVDDDHDEVEEEDDDGNGIQPEHTLARTKGAARIVRALERGNDAEAYEQCLRLATIVFNETAVRIKVDAAWCRSMEESIRRFNAGLSADENEGKEGSGDDVGKAPHYKMSGAYV